MPLSRRLRHALSSSPLRAPLFWYRHLGLRPADVFLASYPRSGNTWLRFVLCDLLTGRSDRFEWVNRATAELGAQGRTPPLLPGEGRLVKTHEPYRPAYRRAVYMVRDVRDVVLSEHALQLGIGVFDGPFDAFLKRFLAGRANGFGTWTSHVESWLAAAAGRPSDILVLRFEDMRSSPETALARIVSFLGLQAAPDAVAAAVRNNTLDRMRAKEDRERDTYFKSFRQDQRFVREGGAGGWRRALTPEQAQAIVAACGTTLARLGYSIATPEAFG